jgi:arylsulfatase A-like enzyme
MKTILMPTFFLIFLLAVRFYAFNPFKINQASSAIRCKDCNVIVISLSNLRKKNMSFYGSYRATTNNIDNFFKNSLVFTHAFAPASITYTDATSFFYSLQPTVHKFFSREDRERSHEILQSYVGFPKVLKSAGYKTAAFVSDEDYSHSNNFGDLFDWYFDNNYYRDYGITFHPWKYNIGTKDLVAPTINWLRQNKSEKFFLFLQAYDMHCPYTPEGKFKNLYQKDYNKNINWNNCYITYSEAEKVHKNNKNFFRLYDWMSFQHRELDEGTLFEKRDLDHLVNLYDAELTNADDNLKPLFDEIEKLGLTKNTIIIFMSEHGDYLGEAGYFMKVAVTAKGNLHNVNLSYPLMIRHPKVTKPFLQNQLIQTIDLGPTILDLVGLAPPKKMQGKSFLNTLGNSQAFNDFAFSGAERKRDFRFNGNFVIQSIQNHEWKYDFYEHKDFSGKTLNVEESLYHLPEDRDEKYDVKEKYNSVFNNMRAAIASKRRYYEK